MLKGSEASCIKDGNHRRRADTLWPDFFRLFDFLIDKMNRKSSLIQVLKSVPKALKSDTYEKHPHCVVR